MAVRRGGIFWMPSFQRNLKGALLAWFHRDGCPGHGTSIPICRPSRDKPPAALGTLSHDKLCSCQVPLKQGPQTRRWATGWMPISTQELPRRGSSVPKTRTVYFTWFGPVD